MKNRWIIAAAAACGLVLLTFPMLGGDATTANVATAELPAGAVCKGEGAARFDFTLKDPAGAPLKMDAYKGKIVLLNFWGTWCPPCRLEIPGFIELQDTCRHQRLVSVGVSVKDKPEAVLAYASVSSINYPLARVQEDIEEGYGQM